MTQWRGSDRRERLPADWPERRKRVLKRDGYRCRWLTAGRRCKARATEVDHVEHGDDHDDSNLQALCTEHHGRKTGREGAQARWHKHDKKFRRVERHPGVL